MTSPNVYKFTKFHSSTLRLFEAGNEEEGGAEEEHHHGRARLRLPESAVDDDLVQPPQLAGERLVLRLEQLDLLVQLFVLDAAAPHAVLHRVHVLLLPLPRVLRRHLRCFINDYLIKLAT